MSSTTDSSTTLSERGLHQVRLFFIALQFFTRVPIPRWVGLQLAGYELALRPTLAAAEAARVKRAAVRLRPDGTYSLFHFGERRDHADFLACARLAHWKLEHMEYQL